MTQFTEGQEERIQAAVAKRITEYSAQGRDIAFGLATSTPDSRDHVVRIGTSILCTKWGVGYPGGSFVQAVVNGDLMETFGRADDVNLNCIRFYVSLLYNQSYVA